MRIHLCFYWRADLFLAEAEGEESGDLVVCVKKIEPPDAVPGGSKFLIPKDTVVMRILRSAQPQTVLLTPAEVFAKR